jgi:tetratricopeptide (TPR) repeat protein
MDIQPNTQEDQRIRSLLKTWMSRGRRFSTDTANAGLGGLSDGRPTNSPLKTGYIGQMTAPKFPSMTRKASIGVVENNPTRIRSTVLPRRNLKLFEKSNDLGTIQSRESHEKSEKEKQEPARGGEDSTKTKMVLASVYHKCGKLEAARIVYEEMLSPSPTSRFSENHELRSVIRCRVAEIHLQEGRFEEAETYFSQLEMESRKLASENGNITWVTLEISRWLGITFDKRGKFEEAHRKLEAVEKEIEGVKEERTSESKRSPDLEKYSMLTKNALALVFAHMGDFARAKATINDAIEIAQRIDGAADSSKHNTIMDLNRAMIFAYSGDYKKATNISQVVSKKLERQFGPKNLATLECWSLQTQLLAANSMPDEAQDRAEETLQRMRNELGKEHPLTLELLGTLVLIHLSQGRIADAMETAQYVSQANTRSHALGPDHPQTINSISTLATVKSAAGQLHDAESLQMEVVRQAEARLGERHPSTVSYKLNLASIYCHMGNWAMSQEITRSMFWMQWNHFLNASSKLKTDQVIVGNEDPRSLLKDLRTSDYSLVNVYPSFLSTMHCLGVTERELDNGDLSLARELLSEAAYLRSKRFGASHADTLWSQFELAKVERECGGIENLREASRIFEMVLTKRRKLLGENHPDTLSARHELSITRFQMGHEDEAAGEHAKVLSLRTKILGTHHPDTIKSKLDLAKVYQSLGDMGEAENLQLAALGEQIRQSKLIELGLSVADEDNKRHLYALILDRFVSNQHTDSNTAPIQTREKPRYYSEIIAAVADLAFTYVELDDTAKRESAADIQEIVVSLQEQYLGNSALKTLVSVNYLGLIYQALDRTQDAITQFKRVCDNTEPHLPLHLAGKSNLASLYFVKGDFKTAESIQKTVLDSQRGSMSNDPKALIESMFNLALMRKERAKKEGGTPTDAIELMEEVVELSETLGHSHPLHIETYDTLAEWLAVDEEGEQHPISN